jgi:hypothetical protein
MGELSLPSAAGPLGDNLLLSRKGPSLFSWLWRFQALGTFPSIWRQYIPWKNFFLVQRVLGSGTVPLGSRRGKETPETLPQPEVGLIIHP